ncbi:fibronectin type III domain-containing protein [Candidatus Rariloculus sp.]|uniref:fibronectin type III domain-containing protein n=1 Tax=Candidatus Rariloculus sp. TaxID=3101265 RepID=UPI003D0ADF93
MRLPLARRALAGSARSLAAALLALCGALVLPATAEAQTAITLVSTVNQSPTTELDGGSVSHERQVGQEFTTGMNEDGFILTSVDIVSASSTEFTAKVCDETSNTATCTDLTISGNFGIGTLSFTAPADTPLTGSTTYTVVLTTENKDSAGFYTTGWGATDATGEDMGAAAGWSIENYYHGHGRTQDPPLTSAWDRDVLSPTLRIAINGYAVGGTTTGICDRTQQVQDAILAALADVDDCAAVTDADLASLTSLDMTSQNIASLKSGDFAGLTSLTVLGLGGNSFTMLPADVFSGLTALTDLLLGTNALKSLPGTVFSSLTALTTLRLNNNALESLPADVFSGLTSLTTLNLNDNALDSLPGTVFSGLTALTFLDLGTNALDSLPGTVFSSLTALTTLRLGTNALDSLPDGVFSGLTALTSLRLNDNNLNVLPDGVLSGLTALETLSLSGNPTDPLPFTVTVEKVGTNQVRAKVLAGAPFAVDIPVTPVNGTLAGSVTALSVILGSVDGTAVTVTRTAGTTAAVTVDVDLSTPPTLPRGHTGYEFVKATVNLPATILPDATNAAPAFTSSATFNPAENQTAVGTVEAEDSDTADAVTGYTLNGGADQALFSITSGVLTFQAAPNYEDPQDANTDNAYVVVVRATSGTGARVKTADQTITVTVMDADEQPDKPAKPTLAAVSGSSTSLAASWTAPGLNGGPELTGYEVRYRSRASATDAWSDSVDWPHTGTTTTTTITGLTATTEYQVDVSALNGETPSAFSDYSDAVRTNSAATNNAPVFSGTPTRTVPENSAAGTNVGAVIPEAMDADNDALTYSMEGTDATSFAFNASTRQITTIAGVDYNYEEKSSYTVTVKASDGTASATVDVTINVTDADEQPDKPAKPTLAAVSGSTTSLDVSWTEPGLNGGPDIAGYRVEYREGTSGGWVNVTHNGAGVTRTITGLTASTEYQVQVQALNGETPSAWSDASDAVSTNAAPTTPPACTLNPSDLWCGVVTVEALDVAGVGVVAYGFSVSVDTGALSDTEFSVGTNDYTIDGAWVATNDGDLAISLTSALTATDKAKLVLDIDGSSDTFAFNDAGGPSSTYEWDSAALDWSSTSSVTLRLQDGTAPTPSTDATLSGLTVTGDGSDLVTFVSGTTDYTAMVAGAVAEVTVTPTTNDTGATIEYLDGDDATLTDTDTAKDEFQVALAEGDNVVKVKVTAEDGNTTETYMVTVTRAASDTTAPTLTSASVVTSGEYLNLTFSERLAVVDTAALTMTLRDAFSLTVDGVGQDISYIGQVTAGDANRLLVYASSTIASGQTVVVSYDQSAADTHAIADPAGNEVADFTTGSGGVPAITNNATTMPPSMDATLSDLVVTAGSADLTLTPTFAPSTTTYTAMVASTVTEVTVTPTLNDTGATTEYLDKDDATLTDANTTDTGHQVAVVEGDNVIKVKVTAQNTAATRTYMVTVNRRAADTPPTTCTLNTGDLWCGVVTVGTYSNGVGFTDSDGALTDNTGDQTITIGSASYTVSSVVILASPAGALVMGLDTQFPASDEETLEFHIGSSTFEVSEATFTDGIGYSWLNSGLSWSVGDTVDVRLRRATDDDAPTISVQDQTVNEGDLDPDNLLEDEGFPFQVTLSAASGQPVRYKVRRVELASDTATGDDLKHEILYLEQGEIAAGETSVYLRADIILDDTLDEPDETFTLEIYDFENATAGDQTRATITIEDDDDPPSVSVADAEATEGDPAEFAVTLSAASGQTVTVGVATSIESSDTALAGDFTAVPTTTLTFMPGDTAETVMVQTTADTLDEPDETFTLTLSSPSNVTLGDATAKGTITNNDNTALASVTIAADQPAFTAKLDDVTFTLTRTGDLAAALDVAVALTQDRPLLNNEHLAQTVTFQAGEATATLIIRSYKFAGHTVTEESTLTATVQAGSGYEPGSPNTVSTRIVVANPAVTAWIEATAYTFAEDATGNDATIAVILRTATGVPVPNRNLYLAVSTQAISGQAESRVDYEPFTLQLEFQPSDFTSDETGPTARQEVTLVIVDDALDESDETLSVFLERSPSLPEVVALRQPDGTACPSSVLSSGCAVTVTIVDNDSATNGDDDLIGGICERTPRVRDRILELLKYRHSYKGDCSGVTTDTPHLAKLKSLDLGRNPSTESAFTMSLQSDDFEGLVNLERLYLRETGLDSLPAGVFSGLAALETLELDNNRLRSLPAGVFSDLLNLKTLELHRNPSLSSLPYDEFEALPSLTKLLVDPEGRRGYQVAGGEGDATLEVAAGGTTTYQVRLTHRPAYIGTASQPTLTVSSDTAGVVAAPTTLRFTKENWFRRQTVTVDAPASAGGATATLSHTSVAVMYDRPIPTVTVRVLENAPGRAADPLTAEFQGLPSSHDGETAFSFRIAFSEAVSVTPEAMRTHVLEVAGGAVTGASRIDGERGAWEITVTPDRREALSITLAPAADCAADGAVCTSDGRALSTRAAAIVNGPADEPERNTAATGTPTIGGTPQVGEELTASTSDISDADGLDNASFAYQWMRASADIGGATGSTYTPVAADEGKRLKVRVSFTDDAGNDERLTSAATDAVAAAPEDAGGSATDSATDSTTGSTTKPPTGSTSVFTTVRVKVADAQVREAPGATLNFAVTLNEAASVEVKVGYRTADLSARAGSDYTAANGTLTIPAGSTSGTVRVTVLDDAHDEGNEKMLLVLYSADGAIRGDYLGIGTIQNTDPMPKAWLARFGRTASDHAVAAIEGRWRSGAEARPQTHLTIGGRRVENLFDFGRVRDGFNALQAGPAAIDPRLDPESAWARMDRLKAENLGLAGGSPAGSGLAGNPAGGGLAGSGFSGSDLAGGGPADSRSAPRGGLSAARGALAGALGLPDLRNGLMGSSFFYSKRPGDGDGPGGGTGWLGNWSAWGNTAATQFAGADGPLSLDGEVATATLGADSRWGRWHGGLALSYSEGDGVYTHPEAAGGAMTSTLTSLHPFARYELNDRTSFWGVLGYGSGALRLTPEGAETGIETDIATAMAAFGGRGVFSVRSSRFGAFELAVVSDVRVSETVSDSVENLMGTAGATSRVRVMLEGSGSMPLATGGVLKPTLEAGLRYDDGDAETGAGLEIGAGLGYAAGVLAVEVKGRMLLAHEDTEYEEWGFSGSIRYQPRSDGRGLSMNLGSAWGATQSGVQSLWSRQDASGLARGAAMNAAQRFQAELGYGFTGRRKTDALWMPFLGAESGDGGAQSLRMGVRLTSGPNLEAGLEFGRLDNGRGAPERAVQLRGAFRW